MFYFKINTVLFKKLIYLTEYVRYSTFTLSNSTLSFVMLLLFNHSSSLFLQDIDIKKKCIERCYQFVYCSRQIYFVTLSFSFILLAEMLVIHFDTFFKYYFIFSSNFWGEKLLINYLIYKFYFYSLQLMWTIVLILVINLELIF